MDNFSRRTFLHAGLGLAATAAFPQAPTSAPLTAAQVVERIKASVGIWLKPFIPEVPIEFAPAVEPFWTT